MSVFLTVGVRLQLARQRRNLIRSEWTRLLSTRAPRK
jgi:hypothetical protein